MASCGKAAGDEPQNIFQVKKSIIYSISADFGTASEYLANGYQRMLEVLGVESYSQADRFALELIQNADEASYASLSTSKTPSITIQAVGKLIDVSYNETGFSVEDVEALCNIGRSGKPETDGIRKKEGIGFKSVFNVCDKVHIGSNGYQFEFDKNDGPFGMVKPKWRPFPKWLKNQDETLVRLSLPDRINPWPLQDRLERMDYTFLLFLRNIEKIHVYTPGVRTLISCQGRGESTTTITTKSWFWDMEPDQTGSDNWEPPNIVDVKYMIVKHICCSTGSEITLAFPLSADWKLWPQKVHNVLPVAEYGFEFIVQSDFHLTPNKEAVQNTEWNQSLREVIPSAFLSAVHQFNDSKDGSSMWIRFLPKPSSLLGFFSSLKIEDYLKDEHILFSQEGPLMKPSELIYVPREFRLRRNLPVTLKFDGRHVISTRYDDSDLEVLERLGVARLDIATFVTALQILGLDGWPHITWHEDLAKILLYINKDLLSDVPLIPVEGCQNLWITPRELEKEPVYSNQDLGGDRIPSGINMRYVKTDTSKRRYRDELFKRFGVKPVDEVAVCEAIQEVLGKSFPSLSIDHAVSQTRYLFRHRHEFSKPNIKFQLGHEVKANFFGDSKIKWAYGSEVYFDDPRESLCQISKILPSMPNLQLLHPSYLQEEPNIDMSKWVDWLFEQQLAVSPRVDAMSMLPQELTTDFEYFVQHAGDSCLCEVLVMHWESYEPHLHIISEVVKKRLNRRILPTRTLRSTAQSLNVMPSCEKFLDMDCSARVADDFRRLEYFGLIIEANAYFYIELLRHHRRTSSKINTKLLQNIYSLLQGCPDANQTRKTFKTEKLIAATIKNVGSPQVRWLTADRCFWSEMSCLQFNSGLCGQYSNCEGFFRSILEVDAVATIEHVTIDLEELAQTKDPNIIREHVKPIVIQISTLLQRSKDDGIQSPFNASLTHEKLKKLRIYPVMASNDKTSELVSGQDFTSGNLLFIPDRPDLNELFKDKVRLLDFSTSEIRKIHHLIESFPCARYLSTEVRKSLSHKGMKSLHRATTDDYRSKHRRILRCIRHYSPPYDVEVDGHLHQKLKSIRVYEVDRLEYVLWLERTTARRSSAWDARNLSAPSKDAVAIVKTFGDAMISQDVKRFTIQVARVKSPHRKAISHSIPELLVTELGLPVEAKGLIALVLGLDPLQALSLLDEMGVARLPDEETEDEEETSSGEDKGDDSDGISVFNEFLSDLMNKTTCNDTE